MLPQVKFKYLRVSSVLLLQVMLLISSEDPVTPKLVDQLSERTGCKVIQVGEEPLNDLKEVVEQRKLEWKDVAYMGKHVIPLLKRGSLLTSISQC